jgi:hypothetical protein
MIQFNPNYDTDKDEENSRDISGGMQMVEKVHESQGRNGAPLGEEPICAVCRNVIESNDYTDQVLNPTHKVNLTIVATAGDAFLPHVLEVHENRLPYLRDKIVEINEGETWV